MMCKKTAIESAYTLLKPFKPNLNLSELEKIGEGIGRTYSLTDACKLLSISKSHGYDLVHEGKLKANKGLGMWRIHESELNRLLGC